MNNRKQIVRRLLTLRQAADVLIAIADEIQSNDEPSSMRHKRVAEELEELANLYTLRVAERKPPARVVRHKWKPHPLKHTRVTRIDADGARDEIDRYTSDDHKDGWGE